MSELNPGVARFRKQLAAETLANGLSLDSLRSVPERARSMPAYARALQLIPHCQLARGVWLSRLRGESHSMPKDWFPAWSQDESQAKCAEQDARWAAYLESLRDSDLGAQCHYQSSEGQRYVSTVDDILIHVFNHSTYHRGQLARLVSECGGQRAGTDYIGFARKAI